MEFQINRKKPDIENQILELFLYDNKLKFSRIEKQIKTRSNKLAYHLKNLVKKGILEKGNDSYKLSETSEYLIPYLTEKNSVISVMLIVIKKDKKIFLIKRNKRPFNEKLCLPGGRLIVGEAIKEATERIMKEKFNVKCKFTKINSISLEHVKKKGKIIHSFLLIFVSAATGDNLDYMNINGKKNKIISSDYYLIKNNLDKKLKLNNFITKSD